MSGRESWSTLTAMYLVPIRPPHGWIAIGLLVHDVAPMAPNGFKVQQNEFVFARCLSEDGIRPWVPDYRLRSCLGVDRTREEQHRKRPAEFHWTPMRSGGWWQNHPSSAA